MGSAGAVKMCNIRSVTTPQAAMRQAARAMVDNPGDLPTPRAIFRMQQQPCTRKNAPREAGLGFWGGYDAGIDLPGIAGKRRRRAGNGTIALHSAWLAGC